MCFSFCFCSIEQGYVACLKKIIRTLEYDMDDLADENRKFYSRIKKITDKLIDSKASTTVMVLNDSSITHPKIAAIWIGTILNDVNIITQGITKIESHQ